MKKRVFNLFMVFAVSVAICIPTNAAREYEENFREVKYMKFKRILSVALVCAVMISCVTNVAATQTNEADSFVVHSTESISTTRASGEFEMTVSAKTKAIADSSLCNGLPVCIIYERVNRYTVSLAVMLTSSATYGKTFLNRKRLR